MTATETEVFDRQSSMPAGARAGGGPGAPEGSNTGRASNRGGGAEQGCSFPPTTSRVDKLSGQLQLSTSASHSCGCREPVERIVEYPSTELGFK